MTTKKYNISGMCCDNCVTHVTEALNKIPKIDDIQVQLDAPQAVITTNQEIAEQEIITAINNAGHYTAEAIKN